MKPWRRRLPEEPPPPFEEAQESPSAVEPSANEVSEPPVEIVETPLIAPDLPAPAERRRRAITEAERERFLEALGAGWSVTHAAERGGHGRQRFYEARDRDEDFAAAWTQAVEAGTDRLEDEAFRRGLEGYDERTFDGEGKLIRRVHRYSDQALLTALKARRPEKWRDNAQLEVKGPAVFVLESAFGRPHDVEAIEVEPVAVGDVSELEPGPPKVADPPRRPPIATERGES